MAEKVANRIWVDVVRPRTLLFPISYALILGGVVGFFGLVAPISIFLLGLTAVMLQIVNNIGRVHGALAFETDERFEMYERKYEWLKRVDRYAEGVEAVDDLKVSQTRSALFTSSALAIIFGYSTIFYALAGITWTVKIAVLAAFMVILLIVILRYVGAWRYGLKPYGSAIVFVIVSVGVFGGFCLIAHTVVYAVIYPAIGLGALAIALCNLQEIGRMDEDLKLKARTMAIVLGAEKTAVAQILILVLATVWFALFLPMLGSGLTYKLFFLVFFIAFFRDAIAFRKSGTPDNLGDFEKSFYLSLLFLSLAFCLCAGANALSLIFMMLVG